MDWCKKANYFRGIVGVSGCIGKRDTSYPKGLNVEQRYRVTFDNSDRTVKIDAFTLVNNGIRINLGSLCSELILFEGAK